MASVAASDRVIVFIDQLDALSALVDRHPERLVVVLELIDQLNALANVDVVFSCRTFEFEFDPRFRRLKSARLELGPLPQERVKTALAGRGVDVAKLPEAIQELLGLPEWLMLVAATPELVALPGPNDATALTAAYLEKAYQRTGREEAARKDVAQIAHLIDDREEAWLPVKALDEEGIGVSALLSAGVLRATQDSQKVAFAHQLIFEHVRAAQLVAEGSLSEFVRRRDGTAFVRPLLRPTLNYLRATDQRRYHAELLALFAQPELRAYMRRELLECIGAADDPTESELVIICQHLEAPRWTHWAIDAVRGRPNWFARLGDTHIGPVLRRSSYSGLPLLTAALSFDRASVFELARRHLVPQLREPDPVHTARVLGWLLQSWDPWDERAQRLARALVGVSDSVDGVGPLGFLLSTLVERSGTSVVSLLSEWMDRNKVDDNPVAMLAQLEGWWPPGGLGVPTHPLLATEIFPRVVARLEMLERQPSLGRFESARVHHWELTDHDVALGLDLRRALNTTALQNSDVFRPLFDRNKSSELMAVHILLVEALIETAKIETEMAVEYLCGDERRLRLGVSKPALSLRLMKAIAPHLSAIQRHRLKTAIDGFAYRIPTREDAEDEARRQAENGRWRELYLAALGVTSSAEISSALEELLNSSGVERSNFGAIGSPVPAEELEGMDDDALLEVFAGFPDSTGWHHPTDWGKGGSIELCRALVALVPKAPNRFAALATRFNPDTHARPAVEIFSALAKSELPRAEFQHLFHVLAARGYCADDDRMSSAAYAWSDRIAKGDLPDDNTLVTMSGWLHDAEVSNPPPSPEDNEGAAPNRSILLGGPTLGIMPGGNYPVLHALTAAFTRGPEPRMQEWASMLETHLNRREDVAVWQAIARNLSWLVSADPGRGERFIDDLFTRVPGVLGSPNGVGLIASTRWEVQPSLLVRWMKQLLTAKWPRSEQAYGEVLACIAFLPNADPALVGELSGLIAPGAPAARRAGALRILVEFWDTPARQEITTLLIQATKAVDEPYVADALAAVFLQRAFFADHDTDRLLEAIVANATSLLSRHEATYMPERLLRLLPRNPEVVYELTRHYVAQSAPMSLHHGGDELVGISLFLQRLGGVHRAHGLLLLDQLFEKGMPKAENFVKSVGSARLQ